MDGQRIQGRALISIYENVSDPGQGAWSREVRLKAPRPLGNEGELTTGHIS